MAYEIKVLLLVINDRPQTSDEGISVCGAVGVGYFAIGVVVAEYIFR